MSPILTYMTQIEISCLMAYIPHWAVCPMKARIASVFSLLLLYFLEYNLNFAAETTKSWLPLHLPFLPHSPPLFLDIVTETFFQFLFAKSFPPSVSLPRLFLLLGTFSSAMNLSSSLSSFSFSEMLFLQRHLSRTPKRNTPLSFSLLTFFFTVPVLLYFCVYLFNICVFYYT